MGEDTIAVGECPECGFVTGDKVRLPSCTCDNCSSSLERVTTAKESRVEKLKGRQ